MEKFSKSDLARLKAEVYKTGAGKLKIILVDLCKLSNVMNNVIKKNLHEKYEIKTHDNSDKSSLEKNWWYR